MDRIATTTTLISGIVEAYDHKVFQTDLSLTMEALKSRFEEFLNDNAINSGLITENAVRPVPYFSVVGRIKESDSFHEKMIRGNLIYKFLEKQPYRSKREILKKKSDVQDIIKDIADDIIGIKILTNVEQDCKKVLKLLIDNHSREFNNKKNIWLNMEDLERQPDKMRNGLLIYKIRGVFRETFQFELQIKSKLLSVWGDMDHSMFYKDYSVSPVKKNVMNSMVSLGNLITQVDQFLFQIREAEKTFSESRSVIEFTESFSNKYGAALKRKLKFGYRLEEISEFLFFLYQQLPKNKKIKHDLDFSLLSIKGTTDLNRHYIELKNRNFNLQIIELIYFNWFSPNLTEQARKTNNYNRHISILLGQYALFLKKHLTPKNEIYSDFLLRNLESLFPYAKNANFLYNIEKINVFFDTLNSILSYSDIDIVFTSSRENRIAKGFLYLCYYGQSADEFLEDNDDGEFINNMKRVLNQIKFDYRDKKISEIEEFKNADKLIQDCLFILKDC